MNRTETLRGLLEAGDPEADRLLARCATSELRLLRDPSSVEAHFRHQAQAGDAEAMHLLAYMILHRLATRIDEQEALELCGAAAELGYAPSLALLSTFHFEGLAGQARDEAKGLDLLNQAATSGYSYAYVLLGVAHIESLVAGTDPLRGINLLRAGAQQGNALAAFQLGITLIKNSDPTALEEGVGMLQSSARRGFPSASRVLADAYSTGRHGVVRNSQLADEYMARWRQSEQSMMDRIDRLL